MLDIDTKAGISLIELIVVVTVIGILASIAIPNFIKTMETTKAREAISSLGQIRAGEIIYRSEENTYWPAGSTESNVATINSQLRLSLDTRELNWDYYVTATTSTFTATARRKSGRNENKTITIDEDGNQGGTWSP
ncbi:MAG: type II secretion system GspH family protein [Candidatus Omnitrophica bacterium]|nr:type II secretion system GspH family protein [Candidatus Omnitrophota bacterium]